MMDQHQAREAERTPRGVPQSEGTKLTVWGAGKSGGVLPFGVALANAERPTCDAEGQPAWFFVHGS